MLSRFVNENNKKIFIKYIEFMANLLAKEFASIFLSLYADIKKQVTNKINIICVIIYKISII